jgi:hypothetical protein
VLVSVIFTATADRMRAGADNSVRVQRGGTARSEPAADRWIVMSLCYWMLRLWTAECSLLPMAPSPRCEALSCRFTYQSLNIR